MVNMTATATMADFGGVRRGAFAQQRLMLRGGEKASLWIAVLVLPACDGVSGGVVERPAVDVGVEPKASQPTLHLQSLRPGKADLIFALSVCLLVDGCRIDGFRCF